MKHSRREFVRVLFVATQATLAGGLWSQTLRAGITPATGTGGLNFLVFGDWGRLGRKDQMEVATQMAGTAETSGANFVISVGDNFYEAGVASVDDLQWHNSFENVYQAAALQIPWQVILGNHDYKGNCEAQIAYSKVSPRWKMPARYYVQSHPIDAVTTADFFYLDTTPMVKSYLKETVYRPQVITQDVPKQLAWFKAALAASTAQWKIVIGHHPIYSGGGHGDTQELIDDILPLLQAHKVQAYFNGHDHDLQHLQAGTVNLFDSGAGSEHRFTMKTKRTKFARSRSGFTAVTLQSDRMQVRMIDNQGKLLYATTVPRVS